MTSVPREYCRLILHHPQQRSANQPCNDHADGTHTDLALHDLGQQNVVLHLLLNGKENRDGWREPERFVQADADGRDSGENRADRNEVLLSTLEHAGESRHNSCA